MKLIPSFPVVFTARVVFHDDDRESFELHQREEIRLLLHRLNVLRVAIQRVRELQRWAAQAPMTSPCSPPIH
jgi:hypothetical protein